MKTIFTKLVADFEHGRMSRRELIQSLVLTATTAHAASGVSAAVDTDTKVKAVGIHHISYVAADYTKIRDFYAGVFGMEVFQDPSNQNECFLRCGDTFITPRNKDPKIDGTSPTPMIDHIALAIEPWENQKNITIADAPTLAAELRRHGIQLLPVGTPRTPRGVKIKDPEGFDVQLIGRNYRLPGT